MAIKKVKKSVEEAPERLKPTVAESEEPRLRDKGEDVEEDYLRQYQYMREMPLGHPNSDPKDGKPKVMKAQLLKQAKVRVMIPVDSGSDPSVPFSVQLNGYRLDLPRNQYIDVPQQVAEVIMNSHNQTNQALNMFKIGDDKGKREALNA